MSIKKCKENGHKYDSAEYQNCPYCPDKTVVMDTQSATTVKLAYGNRARLPCPSTRWKPGQYASPFRTEKCKSIGKSRKTRGKELRGGSRRTT